MNGPVLLVDDDFDDLVALQATLDPLGLEVVKAESGDEALKLLLQRDFALVIMDLMMPRMNGFEVCALIRERDRCRGMPVIILTGFDEDGAQKLPGYRPGTYEFMHKPVPPEALRAKVADCLARYQPAAGVIPRSVARRIGG
ncbi:MAG: response regulator [Elusimicrobia bacterium]|nr:response regulator [Elusimicrobiota bacterium]